MTNEMEEVVAQRLVAIWVSEHVGFKRLFFIRLSSIAGLRLRVLRHPP